MIDNKAIFTPEGAANTAEIIKNAVSNISYGLFVLVARQGEKDNACIINVAQQVTSDPLQLAICVNKQNLTHDMILHTLKFNLCPLCEVSAQPTTLHKAEDPMKPFQHFGFQSGKTVDKFAECEVELRTDNGLRYLPKYINSVISCVVTKSIDLGTHTMFIAMPMEAKVLSDSPSITYAYYQQHIKPKPAAAPAATGKKKWVCEVCGYVYEGDELPDDFVCPWCKHGKSDFKLME